MQPLEYIPARDAALLLGKSIDEVKAMVAVGELQGRVFVSLDSVVYRARKDRESAEWERTEFPLRNAIRQKTRGEFASKKTTEMV